MQGFFFCGRRSATLAASGPQALAPDASSEQPACLLGDSTLPGFQLLDGLGIFLEPVQQHVAQTRCIGQNGNQGSRTVATSFIAPGPDTAQGNAVDRLGR
jgi:hypothetical protein